MSSKGKNITSKGLPIVSQEMIEAIWQAYTTGGDSWGARLTETQKRLVSEQPALVKFIESQVGKHPKSMHRAIFEVVIATITVIEEASEVNYLSNLYKI